MNPSARLMCMLASTAALSSCASSGAESTASTEPQLDFATYETAAFAFRDCFTTHGHELTRFERSERFPEFYEFVIPGVAISDGTEDLCYYQSGFADLERQWHLQWFYAHPELDPEHQYLVACGQQAGIDFDRSLPREALRAQLEAAGLDLGSCL